MSRNSLVRRRTPRLVQWLAVGKVFYERSGLAENINVAARTSGSGGERNIDLAIDVLDSERREARRDFRIGEETGQIEVSVININLVVGASAANKEFPDVWLVMASPV